MSKIIGVFPMFNTEGICVHAIDDAEDKVLASVNGENPEWYEMAEHCLLYTSDAADEL